MFASACRLRPAGAGKSLFFGEPASAIACSKSAEMSEVPLGSLLDPPESSSPPQPATASAATSAAIVALFIDVAVNLAAAYKDS